MLNPTPVVTLREITPDNYNIVIRMQVREDQKNFVASNLYSLAEARVFPSRFPLAIYADETPVGFLMSAYQQETGQHWIFRLMIAAEFQGRQYGRAAMRLLIERMQAIPGCRQIYISYEPDNDPARQLYASLGFRANGEILGGEEVAVLDFEPQNREARMKPYDLDYLRKAIQVASHAREHGNHPFGAVLVDASGQLVLEAENTVNTAHDCTGHAETNLIRKASAVFTPEELAGCTLYTSTEPCAMCSGAIFWSGVGRIVYALSERGLLELVAPLPGDGFLNLPCREVFKRGGRAVDVLGPSIEEEAQQVHIGFW